MIWYTNCPLMYLFDVIHVATAEKHPQIIREENPSKDTTSANKNDT